MFVAYPGIIALDLVGPHEVFTAAAEVARRTGRDADAYCVEVAAPDAGVVRTTRGPLLVADRALSSVRGAIDTVVMVGRRRRARRRDRRRRSSPACAGSHGGPGGSRRCAPARTCSRPRDCSTAGGRPPTGRGAKTSRASIPTSPSTPTRSSCVTATCGRRPASPPGWTSRSRSSTTTWDVTSR